MKIVLSPKTNKQLRKISKVNQIILAKKIRSLKSATKILNQSKLSGYKNIYRIRIGNFRIVYRKTSNEIYIILIGHRKDIYDILKKPLK